MNTKGPNRVRQGYEPPPIIGRGWRYHHLGIPTSVPHPEERHLKHLKVFVRGFEASPFGIEWMRFEPDCEIHELIKQVPHVAFEVDDIEEAIAGFNVIYPISSPSEGVRSAMIVHDGAPIELIEFSAKRKVAKSKRRGGLTKQ
ncbi:MAG TPA: hypothetical protein VEI58_03065 [Chthoniobacterales bacterium]|nr:hypothetical protein [Chthoniobacterales bacterium]